MEIKLSKLSIATLALYSPLLLAAPQHFGQYSNNDSSGTSYVYTAERGINGNVGMCVIDSETGALRDCKNNMTIPKLKFPEGVTVNPQGSRIYIANNLPHGRISVCDLDQSDGSLKRCKDAGGNGFAFPDATAFSPDGSVIYVVNGLAKPGNTIALTACEVDAKSGKLSKCKQNPDNSFAAPAWIDVNQEGSLAYIANFSGNTISVCPISGTSITSACQVSDNLGLDLPDSVTLNADETKAYISNNGGFNMMACDVAPSSSGGGLSSCVGTPGTPGNPTRSFTSSGLVFNPAGTKAYISNFLGDGGVWNGTITVCDADQSSKNPLSNCHPTKSYTASKRISGIAIATLPNSNS